MKHSQSICLSLPKSSPSPIAYYIGELEGTEGAPSIRLFNLLVSLPSLADPSIYHPVESTVSEQTLLGNGVRAPYYLTVGQQVTR